MFPRFFYASQALWCYRRQLLQYVQRSTLQITDIVNIEVADLQDMGVRALVLDFDGVLAPHHAACPDLEVVIWLQQVMLTFEGPIFILSNLPTFERQAYFAKQFPRLQFVRAARKKPYPDGIEEILKRSGLQPSELLVIDDRLATGILAAIGLDVPGLWLTKARTNYRRHFWAELGFGFLRLIERKLVLILP